MNVYMYIYIHRETEMKFEDAERDALTHRIMFGGDEVSPPSTSYSINPRPKPRTSRPWTLTLNPEHISLTLNP